MFKWFLLLLAGYLVLRMLARIRAKPRRSVAGERVVPCAQCGLNLPESEAIREEGGFFCCRRHFETWKQAH